MSARQLSNVELAIFLSRVEAVCTEMGTTLRYAALSPNIKDRLDFSCALFDERGEMFAQAAHIPVHLGSMAYAMRNLVGEVDWQDGDVLIVNDPYLGGTHLPDVTLVSPVFVGGSGGTLVGFVANRAHHANIGATTPGSMPISTTLEEEGMVIPPTLIVKAHEECRDVIDDIAARAGSEMLGDLQAQLSANRVGVERLARLAGTLGIDVVQQGFTDVNDYGARVAMSALADLPKGTYQFSDAMDDDGMGGRDIGISVTLTITDDGMHFDFAGTSAQVRGNINCPLSVTAAAVFYAVRCTLPETTPASAGTFRHISIAAEEGSLVNATRPAAVAAGNVETSMRIVDVALGALAKALPGKIPAASQGTMNNVAMGNHDVAKPWDYYETMAGGAGAGPNWHGAAAVQSHMTNTLNTPVESLEMHYPLRVLEYSVRNNSGGAGKFTGGDGVCREIEFLAPAEVTLITERRTRAPWGLADGEPGEPGCNTLDGSEVPGKCQLTVAKGARLRVETPGGGGFGG